MSMAMTMPAAGYRHSQSGAWCFVLYAIAAVELVTAAAFYKQPAAMALMLFAAALVATLGASFRRLTITDGGDHLDVRFGPLTLFRRRVRYGDIRSVEIGRTTLLEGWGVKLSPRGGWVWSIWGRDCVVIRGRDFTLRLGTNDAVNLQQFLRSRAGCDANSK